MSLNTNKSSLQEMAEDIFGLTVLAWRRHAADRSGTHELTEAQYLTLDYLHNHSQATVGEIQRSMGVLPAQMSRIIKTLESGFEKALITRELNKQDRRKIDVRITAEGQKLYREFRNSRLEQTEELLGQLPEQERVEFVRICRKFKELYQAKRA